MALLRQDAGALRFRSFTVLGISGDPLCGIARMQDIAGSAFNVYQDPDGELLEGLGLVDKNEDRDHPVAIPSTLFVNAQGRLQGIVTARVASDLPRRELLLLAADHFSERESGQ